MIDSSKYLLGAYGMPDTVKTEHPSKQTTVFALVRLTFQCVYKESKQINEKVYIDCQKVIILRTKIKQGMSYPSGG